MKEEKVDRILKSDKIFKRLCKEMGIYPGKFYKHIMNFFDEGKTYVFYGRDDASYSSYGEKEEIGFYKLQLDLARRLIEENLLTNKDYGLLLDDTLSRYDVNRAHQHLPRWSMVAKRSGKKDFLDFFIPQYEKNIGRIPERRKKNLYDSLPKY